jgi:hypothetical protein
MGCATAADLRLAHQQTQACLELRQERLMMIAAGRAVDVPSCVAYQRREDEVRDQLDEQRRFGQGLSNAGTTTGNSITAACARGGC